MTVPSTSHDRLARSAVGAAEDHAIMADRVLPVSGESFVAESCALVHVWGTETFPEPAVAENVRRLIGLARELDWDIALVVSSITPEAWSSELARLALVAGCTVRQARGVSVFADAGILSALRNGSCRRIVLTGARLQHEIDVTARDGADLGFEVWIARLAVEDVDGAAVSENLRRLQTYSGVHVIDSQALLTRSNRSGERRSEAWPTTA